jgi:membrane associated rhomboid family serine protease
VIWWEYWTCQFAHWDARHLLFNLIAALPPLVLAPPPLRRRILPWLLVLAPLLTVVVRLATTTDYRGASGLVVALWALVGVTQRSAPLLLALAAKLAAEACGLMPESQSFVTLAAVHYAGAIAGVVTGIALCSTNRFRFV